LARPEKLRVLMTADPVGGVFTYALELARALAGTGATVSLATMGRRLATHQRREAAGVPGLSVFEKEYRLEWMKDPWPDVARAGDWLLRLEAITGADVVQINGFAHGALPWRAPAVVVGHSCVLSWWRAVRGEHAPHEWDRYRARCRAGLRAADAVLAPSRAMLRALEQDHGPLARASVVPNGRSPSFVAPAAKAPFALAAGRLWDEAKNLAALDRAAARVSWPVLVAGDDGGPAPAPGRRAIRLGPLPPPVLASWLALAAVYALPARYEPFGLSVLEAALAGCALVLGDIESLRENWDGLACFVDPDDDEALAAEIGRLCGSPAAAAEAGARARRRALELSPERMARGYREVYARVLGQGRSWSGACAS
jgi:glycosyltransferase involved in cell wall biosynthesis